MRPENATTVPLLPLLETTVGDRCVVATESSPWCIASPKSNPVVAHLRATRVSWQSISRKLARRMVPESLPLATAPPWFPADGPGSCASLAAGCGFEIADNGQGSGAATPERCRRCSVQDWPPARTGFAPTPPQRGPCGCAANPARVFSAPALGSRSRILLVEREPSSLQEAFPLYTVRPKRRGEDLNGGRR